MGSCDLEPNDLENDFHTLSRSQQSFRLQAISHEVSRTNATCSDLVLFWVPRRATCRRKYFGSFSVHKKRWSSGGNQCRSLESRDATHMIIHCISLKSAIISLSLSLSHSLPLSLSLSVCLSACLPGWLAVCLCLSLSVSVCLSLSLSLSRALSLSFFVRCGGLPGVCATDPRVQCALRQSGR